MLGSLNKCKIIKWTNKGTLSEDIDNIHNIILDIISENMDSLVYTGIYGAINITDIETMEYYVIRYVSDTFTLQEYTTIDCQVNKYIELSVREKHLSEIRYKTIWYW